MIEVAHRTSPMPGEVDNGDAVVVRLDELSGRALVAVIDGLGHGPKAAAASGAAVAFLGETPLEGGLLRLMEGLHLSLRGTRGAAATVCLLEGDQLSVCGVGNVSLRSLGTQVPFMLSPGILGGRVPRYRVANAQLRAGDRLLLHSDGIRTDFHLEGHHGHGAEATCHQIFNSHRRPTDDATVLVCDVAR